MPVKRRLSKQRDVRLTHEAVELFRRGLAGEDVHTELHPALGLRPWQPSPLQIDPDDYLGSVVGELHPGLTWSQSKPFVAQLRRRLEEELAEALWEKGGNFPPLPARAIRRIKGRPDAPVMLDAPGLVTNRFTGATDDRSRQ